MDVANVHLRGVEEGNDQSELRVLQEKISNISTEMDSLLNELDVAKEKYERAEQERQTLKSLKTALGSFSSKCDLSDFINAALSNSSNFPSRRSRNGFPASTALMIPP